MHQRLIPSIAALAARTVVLSNTWPFGLTAWRWAQRCRAAGAATYSVEGRVAARLVAGSAAAGWRLVVGPRTPLGLLHQARARVVVTADDDDLPSPALAAAAGELWVSSAQAAERLRRSGVAREATLVPFLGAAPALPPTAGRARPAPPWRLVCTARPTWRCGVDDLLAALAGLERRGESVRLRLVDDGSEAATAARSTAAARGLAGIVEFRPLPSFEELGAWLAWAHAFVLPAVDDGAWPETAEARRAGLPMIVVDQPSLRSRLAGWPPAQLVAPNRPDALAEAVRARLGGPRRLGRAGPDGHPDVASGLVAG